MPLAERRTPCRAHQAATSARWDEAVRSSRSSSPPGPTCQTPRAVTQMLQAIRTSLNMGVTHVSTTDTAEHILQAERSAKRHYSRRVQSRGGHLTTYGVGAHGLSIGLEARLVPTSESSADESDTAREKVSSVESSVRATTRERASRRGGITIYKCSFSPLRPQLARCLGGCAQRLQERVTRYPRMYVCVSYTDTADSMIQLIQRDTA
jgi:hypothetical protein